MPRTMGASGHLVCGTGKQALCWAVAANCTTLPGSCWLCDQRQAARPAPWQFAQLCGMQTAESVWSAGLGTGCLQGAALERACKFAWLANLSLRRGSLQPVCSAGSNYGERWRPPLPSALPRVPAQGKQSRSADETRVTLRFWCGKQAGAGCIRGPCCAHGARAWAHGTRAASPQAGVAASVILTTAVVGPVHDQRRLPLAAVHPAPAAGEPHALEARRPACA